MSLDTGIGKVERNTYKEYVEGGFLHLTLHDIINSVRKALKWDYTERKLFKEPAHLSVQCVKWVSVRIFRLNFSFCLRDKSYLSIKV